MAGKKNSINTAGLTRKIVRFKEDLLTRQIDGLNLEELKQYEQILTTHFQQNKTQAEHIFTTAVIKIPPKLMKIVPESTKTKEDALRDLGAIFNDSARLYTEKLAEIDKIHPIIHLIDKLKVAVTSEGNTYLNRLNDIRLNLSKQERTPEILEKLKTNAVDSQKAYEHIKNLKDSLSEVVKKENLTPNLRQLAEEQLKNATAVLERCDQLREVSIEQAKSIDKEDRSFLGEGPVEKPQAKQAPKPAQKSELKVKNQPTSWMKRFFSRKKPGEGKKPVQNASHKSSLRPK